MGSRDACPSSVSVRYRTYPCRCRGDKKIHSSDGRAMNSLREANDFLAQMGGLKPASPSVTRDSGRPAVTTDKLSIGPRRTSSDSARLCLVIDCADKEIAWRGCRPSGLLLGAPRGGVAEHTAADAAADAKAMVP